MTRRFLARRIISGDRKWNLSTLIINDDGTWRIEPFDRETHSTVFVEGTIIIGSEPPESHRILSENPLVSIVTTD